MIEVSRRMLMAGGLLASAVNVPAFAATRPSIPVPTAPTKVDPAALAHDEAYWAKVAAMYDYPKDVIQLESGQFGAMARPVHRAYERYLDRINTETTLYTRGTLNEDLASARRKAAAMLGVDTDEIIWTRGGTESMMTLIGGYNRLRVISLHISRFDLRLVLLNQGLH